MKAKINKRTLFLGLFSLGLCSSLLPSCLFAKPVEEHREDFYSRSSFSRQDRHEKQVNSPSKLSQDKYRQGEIHPKRQQGLRISDKRESNSERPVRKDDHRPENRGRWEKSKPNGR